MTFLAFLASVPSVWPSWRSWHGPGCRVGTEAGNNKPLHFALFTIFDSSNIYDNIVARVWQILCGYQPAGRGEEVVRRKREEYAGYVDQYFNNKEEDIHKDTFRYDRILPSILILV